MEKFEESRRAKWVKQAELEKRLAETGKDVCEKLLSHILGKGINLEEQASKIQGRLTSTPYGLEIEERSAISADINK